MATVTRKILIIVSGPIIFYITRKLVPPPPPRSEYFAKPTNLPPKDDLRGGDLTAETKKAIAKRVLKEIRYTIQSNLPLIVSFAGVLISVLSADFHDESIALLIQLSKLKLNLERLNTTEKELMNFIEDLDLKNSSDRIRERVITDHMNLEDKWKLWQLKLKSLGKKEVWGDNKTVILGLLSLFIMVYINFPSGYGSFLGLILKLFRDGKISKAAFDELRETALALDAAEVSKQVMNITTTIFNNKTVQEQVINELTELAD